MRSPVLLIAVFGIALNLAFSCSAANLLQNADFEAIDLQGWKPTPGSTVYRLVEDEARGQCVEGTQTTRIGDLGRLIQPLDGIVTPGMTYRLAGCIKTLSVQSEGGVVIGIGAVNKDGALLPNSFNVELGKMKGTTNWNLFESEQFVLPALTPGAVRYAVYIDFNGNGSGRARFDDIVLTPTVSGGAWSMLQIGGVGLLGVAIVFAGVFLGMWAYKKFERRPPSWEQVAQ